MPTLVSTRSIALRRAVFATGIQTDQRLIQLKVVLEVNGITDLATLGDLRLGEGKNIVVTQGLSTPGTSGSIVGQEVQLPRVYLAPAQKVVGSPSNIPIQKSFLRAHSLQTRPFRAPVLAFSSTLQYPLAYWVANEIEITDNTIVVFTNQCEELYIVANKVRIGSGVQFTWQEPSDHSRAKPKLSPPAQPKQNKKPDTQDQVIHGTERVHGKDGNFDEPRRFRDGVDAPSIEIWTLDFDGRPKIMFSGQDGQPGQDGQDGSKGQNGANGIGGKIAWTPVGGYWCERLGGSGGTGASGGNGGNGGDGGNGGQGGKFILYAPQTVLQRIAENGFHCDMAGGSGGAYGRGGRRGEGGEGGFIGKTDRSVWPGTTSTFAECGPKPGARNGPDGSRGTDGDDGRAGQDGTAYETSVRLTPINENDFIRQLSKPAIQRIDKDQVTVGERITIEGCNFTNTDKVFFNEHETLPAGVTGNSQLLAVVPENSNGGNVRVTIRQADGTTSNPYTIIVKSTVTSIEQPGRADNRFMPGKEITIRGSGFSPDAMAFANDIQQENFVFVNNKELKVRLVRPFGHDEFPNAAGEQVDIKVKIPATRAGTVESNAFNITLDTFRMLVLGDSIQWGQGLQDHQKIHQLVADEIRDRAGNIGVYKTVLAHSGAIIGKNDNLTDPPIAGEFGGEVNTNFPTVREQVLAALDGKEQDDTMDFVLVDEGINDVDIRVILNPLDSTLDTAINNCCFKRMKELLKKIAEGFPKAKVIVTGYYRIASNSTDRNLLGLALMGFGLAVAGFPGVVGGLVLDAVTMDAVIARCLKFKEQAHVQIANAIAQTIATVPGASGRFLFADPGFTEGNAIFATDALVFGINADFSPQDNDAVADGRAVVCAANPGRGDLFTCPIASIGHPTPAGAKSYASSVIAQLRLAIPEMFV